MQALAEGVAGGGVVLLIEESFAHAEVGKRSAGLGAKSFLVLHDGIVKLALFGKIFATGNGGAGAEPGTGFEDDVVRIDLDPERLGATKDIHRKLRL